MKTLLLTLAIIALLSFASEQSISNRSSQQIILHPTDTEELDVMVANKFAQGYRVTAISPKSYMQDEEMTVIMEK